MSTPPDLLSLARQVLAHAAPGEQVEAYLARGVSTSVRAYNGEVEAFTQAASAGAGVRVIGNGRQGFASAGSLDPDILATLVAEARDNASFSTPDEFLGLASPSSEPTSVGINRWHQDVVDRGADWKIAQAIELERIVRGGDPRISGVRAAAYSDSASERAIVSTTGIESVDRATMASLSVSALAQDESGTTSGGGSTFGRSSNDLDLAQAASDAVRRTTQMLGATKPATGRITVVLEPRMAATLLGIVASTLSASAALKQRSLFADRVGQLVASPALTMWNDPTNQRSVGAHDADGEGVPCRCIPLITNGVLDGLLHNTYTARRMGTVTTASAVRGARSTPGVGVGVLVVGPGSGDLNSLIADTSAGLLVTSFSGLHSGVNTVSGDFSVGIEGLMIRNGEIAEPVREATLGSTLNRLLTQIVAVGADMEWQPSGSGTGSLVLDDLTMSGL